jgi:thiol-disulfide isomerase/thioredoxin
MTGRTRTAFGPFVLLLMLSLTPASAGIPGAPLLSDLAGSPFVSASFDDRIVLVNFWATWCAPCRKEMPDLDELQNRFDPDKFTVVGIAADEMAEVRNYLDEVPVDYPIYVGDPDQVFAWSEALGNRVVGLPFSALLDHTGTVRWVKAGGRIAVEEMTPLINQLLQEKASTGELQ